MGARLAGGRWNHPGEAVVYVSGTLSLAALELFVHLDARSRIGPRAGRHPGRDPGGAHLRNPRDFHRTGARNRRPPRPRSSVRHGCAREHSCVLRVPSVLIPVEDNYRHRPRRTPTSRASESASPRSFSFDPRNVEAVLTRFGLRRSIGRPASQRVGAPKDNDTVTLSERVRRVIEESPQGW